MCKFNDDSELSRKSVLSDILIFMGNWLKKTCVMYTQRSDSNAKCLFSLGKSREVNLGLLEPFHCTKSTLEFKVALSTYRYR